MIAILVLVLLCLRPDELQELARSLGKSVNEFNKAQMEVSGKKNNLKDHQKDMGEKIHKFATEMGIDIENRTTEQLVEELRIKMRK